MPTITLNDQDLEELKQKLTSSKSTLAPDEIAFLEHLVARADSDKQQREGDEQSSG